MLYTHVVGLLLPLLSTTTKAEDQMESRLLLDVVIAQRAAIHKLLASENETLLIGRDTAYPSACEGKITEQRRLTPPYPEFWP